MTEMEATPKQPESSSPAPVLVIFLIIPLLGILVALVMVAMELRNTQSDATVSNPAQLINFRAPDFLLDKLDGGDVALSEYGGKILFLNFWQTTCVPCITEMPEFMAFFAEQDPEEVALLAVNFDETPERIRQFFATYDIVGIPTALDPDSTVRYSYGVQGIPVTFIIDARGVIRFMHIGGMDMTLMQDYLNRVRESS